MRQPVQKPVEKRRRVVAPEIIALASALARMAARMDHEAEKNKTAGQGQAR